MLLQSFSYNLSGIIPYENYIYEIENINANWPVRIVPLSGSINSSTNNTTIDSKISFCENLSPCSGYMNYSSDLYRLGDDPFVDVRVKLTSDSLDYPIYSDIESIVCSGCFAVPSISVAPDAITLTDTNDTDLLITFNNIKPYTEYFYSFHDINSNYPLILTNIPKTGSFISSDETNYTLKANLVFCFYENCVSPTFGSGYVSKIEKQQCEKYYGNFNISLGSNYLISSIVSDAVTLECDDCLPKIVISTPTSVVLDDTSNQYSLISSFNGLKPYNKYSYEIILKEANHRVSFSSLSGYFYTKNETNKNIVTKLSFCESSGLCEYGNNLADIIDYDCSKNKFIEFNVKLDSDCLDNSVMGDIVRIECDNCLPVININTPPKVVLTEASGNAINFNVSVAGLKTYSDYVYSFKNFSSNHLIGIKELSGTINTKNSTSISIPNSLVFCESSGYCNNYVTTGTMNNDICNNLLSSSFNLELSGDCLAQPVVSNKIEMDCDNCLPSITVSLPTGTSTLTSTNLMSITGLASGLKPFQAYSYYFTGDNNWPIILDNISGSFVPTSTTASVDTKLLFCSPSGSCAEENGLLPYQISTPAQKAINNNLLYGKLKLNIRPLNCNDIEYSSNIYNVYCDDCLPCITYANASISGSPTIILDDGCCVGQKLLTVTITNSVPGDQYTYKFSTSSGVGINAIEFNPVSGEMYFGSGGTGAINTICSVDLADYSQSLINFELTNTNTNFKVFDTVGLICNTGSCY